MTSEIVSKATALLRQHYGSLPEPGPRGEWTTLVRVVLERGQPLKKVRDWSWIEETALRTSDETVTSSASHLAESLDEAGYSARDATLLRALAKWWTQTIGDAEDSATFQSRSLENWQAQLRVIRGVNWELADRILLLVCRLPVYPLDRGSMRIAARHGWVDMHAEYDDWQAFFVGDGGDRVVDLMQSSQWHTRLGREFCGTQPKCEECPLKALLPARGPLLLDEQ